MAHYCHSRTQLSVCCLHSREYQARPAGGGPLDDFDDVNKRVASGEFFSTPSPPSCKVFVTNVSNII